MYIKAQDYLASAKFGQLMIFPKLWFECNKSMLGKSLRRMEAKDPKAQASLD
jgi:hypothetical protein